MYLHNSIEDFEKIIEETSKAFKIEISLVEKDYYISLFLQRLIEKEPLIIFKGGTSLSKCYKLIDRFSEDIDINLENVNSLPQSRKKRMKEHIESVIAELGFTFKNPERIKSGRSHNAYRVGYPSLVVSEDFNTELIVETMFLVDAFPTQRMKAGSLIYDYLAERNYTRIISDYNLEPFEVTVQALERTFVDKVFALGTHYTQNRMVRQSRHLYDLHKIMPNIKLDKSLLLLFDEVRKAWSERKGQPELFAAEDEKDLVKLLNEIIDSNAYRKDYVSVTANLLYENVGYVDTIKSLKKVVALLESDMEM